MLLVYGKWFERNVVVTVQVSWIVRVQGRFVAIMSQAQVVWLKKKYGVWAAGRVAGDDTEVGGAVWLGKTHS
jgi:hypothetical protein